MGRLKQWHGSIYPWRTEVTLLPQALREQREEADPGKECRIVLVQPENQLSANDMGFLYTLIASDDTDISTAIGEDLGHWDVAALYAPVCG
jgi:hypothetical protein